MIIGSGLLATGFKDTFERFDDVVIYAAGVSNSSCKDEREFAREKKRLQQAIDTFEKAQAFIYFSTCSLLDTTVHNTPYVQHKLRMEQVVAAHSGSVIIRLPQVAGRTPNPHTLLNFLHSRISRSERFSIWRHARRNVIDVEDVRKIVQQIVFNYSTHNAVINVANTVSYSMQEIVSALELVCGKSAVYDLVDKGDGYVIDTNVIAPILQPAGVRFGEGYLSRVLEKYYGQ